MELGKLFPPASSLFPCFQSREIQRKINQNSLFRRKLKWEMFAVNEPRLPLGFLKGLCIYYFLIGIIPVEWSAQIESVFLWSILVSRDLVV